MFILKSILLESSRYYFSVMLLLRYLKWVGAEDEDDVYGDDQGDAEDGY
jgi:hypothetical protein